MTMLLSEKKFLTLTVVNIFMLLMLIMRRLRQMGLLLIFKSP